MRLYRISKPQHVPTALHGYGTALAPGRWNSIGVRLGYTATSVSLAMLEVLVHMNAEDVPTGRRLLTYEIPDDLVHDLPPEDWPARWAAIPYGDDVRVVGDRFIADGLHLALRVPSAVARGEFNVLVNPTHASFGQIALLADEELAMDARLFE